MRLILAATALVIGRTATAADNSAALRTRRSDVAWGTSAVVGDFDPREVTEVATAVFGDWKSPAGYARIRDQYKEVPGGVTALETPDKANAILFAGSNLPVADTTADFPSLAIADYIFGGSAFDSRLMLRIRSRKAQLRRRDQPRHQLAGAGQPADGGRSRRRKTRRRWRRRWRN
jgi:hypothetical protein